MTTSTNLFIALDTIDGRKIMPVNTPEEIDAAAIAIRDMGMDIVKVQRGDSESDSVFDGRVVRAAGLRFTSDRNP